MRGSRPRHAAGCSDAWARRSSNARSRISRWGNTAQTYEEAFPALRHVWIEESDVLEILPSKHLLEFELDVALMTTHPDYLGPAQWADFDIDIRRRWLLLESSAIEFEPGNLRPERDASGEQSMTSFTTTASLSSTRSST